MFASQLGSVTCSFFIIPSALVIVLICLGLPPPVTSLNIGIFILLHSLVASLFSFWFLYFSKMAAETPSSSLSRFSLYHLSFLSPLSHLFSKSKSSATWQLLTTLNANSDLKSQFVLFNRQLFLCKGFTVDNRQTTDVGYNFCCYQHEL